MASDNPNRSPMYPQVDHPTPSAPPISSATTSSLYPTIDMTDLVENLFPDQPPSAPPESVEHSLIAIPGAILHLIDKHYSVELATGDLRINRLSQGGNTVAVLATVADDIQWPLTKDLAAVKLDSSHYFFAFRPMMDEIGTDSDSSDEEVKEKKSSFSFRFRKGKEEKTKVKEEEKVKEKENENEMLNYGLTILSKGQEAELLKNLDRVLESYCNFSVQKVEAVAVVGTGVKDVTIGEVKMDEKKKDVVEGQCAAYWTTLAPNVEEYSGTAAKLIATGSGHFVKGILWCGDVTMERLNWGNEVLKKRMAPGTKDAEIDPSTLKRIKRLVADRFASIIWNID